jgi:hypothetical protein
LFIDLLFKNNAITNLHDFYKSQKNIKPVRDVELERCTFHPKINENIPSLVLFSLILVFYIRFFRTSKKIWGWITGEETKT